MERETYDLFTGLLDNASKESIHKDSRTNLVNIFNFLIDERRRLFKEIKSTDFGEFIDYNKDRNAYRLKINDTAINTYPNFLALVSDIRLLDRTLMYCRGVSNYQLFSLFNSLINEDDLHGILLTPRLYILSRIDSNNNDYTLPTIDLCSSRIIWQALANICIKNINMFASKTAKNHEIIIKCPNKL